MTDKEFINKILSEHESKLKTGNIESIYYSFIGSEKRAEYTSQLTKILLSLGYTPEQIIKAVCNAGYYSWIFYKVDSTEKVTVPYLNDYTLAGSLFEECSNLKTVIIAEGFKDIQSDVFKNCKSLKDVYLPSTVEFISKDVFAGCNNTTLHINKTKQDWDNNVYIDPDSGIKNCKLDFLGK